MMNTKTTLASLAIGMALFTAPSLAQAKDTSHTFRVTARVPVACWVKPETVITAQEASRGNVVEACNNPGGYTVTAQYRPLKNGEMAKMVYNNRPINLSASGQQILRRSNVAAVNTVQYQFQNVKLENSLTVQLTIQPY